MVTKILSVLLCLSSFAFASMACDSCDSSMEITKCFHEKDELRSRNQFRISFNFGLGQLIAQPDESMQVDQQAYINELRSGRVLSIDLAYINAKRVGIGLRVSNFSTYNSAESITGFDPLTGEVTIDKTYDDMDVFFVGPSISKIFVFNNPNLKLDWSLAVGYVNFKNDSYFTRELKFSGNTLGINSGLSLDMKLHDQLFFGVEVQLFRAVIDEMEVDFGPGYGKAVFDLDEAQSFSRVDFNVGLRAYF